MTIFKSQFRTVKQRVMKDSDLVIDRNRLKGTLPLLLAHTQAKKQRVILIFCYDSYSRVLLLIFVLKP